MERSARLKSQQFNDLKVDVTKTLEFEIKKTAGQRLMICPRPVVNILCTHVTQSVIRYPE